MARTTQAPSMTMPLPGDSLAGIQNALGSLPYPISKQEAIRRLGEAEFPYDDLRVPLANLLRGVPVDDFPDEKAAQRAVGERWTRLARMLEEVSRAERGSEE